MTIKDMELQTGLARANIRYYEAEGLITPERKTAIGTIRRRTPKRCCA